MSDYPVEVVQRSALSAWMLRVRIRADGFDVANHFYTTLFPSHFFPPHYKEISR